jgi:tetratricopeptide (TPR) repeat protein
MPRVSFAADIQPLFRAIDIAHMKRFGVELDNYAYTSDPNNANGVLANVSPREAMERQHYADARKHIAHALEIYPNYALALELRGILNFREDHLEEACSDFRQAVEYDPNLGAAYLSLGAVYNRLGRFQEAVVRRQFAGTVTRLTPGSPDTGECFRVWAYRFEPRGPIGR